MDIATAIFYAPLAVAGFFVFGCHKAVGSITRRLKRKQ